MGRSGGTPVPAGGLLVEPLEMLQRRFQAGDGQAFARLAEPHLDALYTLCLRMTNSHADADELAQETLVRALDRHELYRPGAPVRPWLLTIAANLCRSRMRSPWWKRALPLFGTERGRANPEADVDGADQDARVREAMARLPVIYREALALFYLEDMSYNEMADITGVAVPALKQRVRRGRDMLKETILGMYPQLAFGRMEVEDES